MTSLARRRRLRRRTLPKRKVLPVFIQQIPSLPKYPELVIVKPDSKFPQIQGIWLSQYNRTDHYLGSDKSKVVNAISILHLAGNVKTVVLNDVEVGSDEAVHILDSIKYLKIFGMKFYKSGKTNLEGLDEYTS